MAPGEPSLGARLGLSVLGTGYLGRGGGTLAAALALVPAWFLGSYPLILAGVFLIFAGLGVWGSFYAERTGWLHDDSRITIDEFSGMLIASLWIPRSENLYVSLLVLGISFLVFRVLDIFKPPPVKWVERLQGGWGVMADDIVAGVIANGLVQLARLLPGRWLGA